MLWRWPPTVALWYSKVSPTANLSAEGASGAAVWGEGVRAGGGGQVSSGVRCCRSHRSGHQSGTAPHAPVRLFVGTSRYSRADRIHVHTRIDWQLDARRAAIARAWAGSAGARRLQTPSAAAHRARPQSNRTWRRQRRDSTAFGRTILLCKAFRSQQRQHRPQTARGLSWPSAGWWSPGKLALAVGQRKSSHTWHAFADGEGARTEGVSTTAGR